MKLERGYLHAKKIGGADAFGFYERTPSLPYAIKEDPRLELHPHFDEAIANTARASRHFNEAMALGGLSRRRARA